MFFEMQIEIRLTYDSLPVKNMIIYLDLRSVDVSELVQRVKVFVGAALCVDSINELEAVEFVYLIVLDLNFIW